MVRTFPIRPTAADPLQTTRPVAGSVRGERPLLLVFAAPGGDAQQQVVRLTSSGVLDSSFGSGGRAVVGRDGNVGGLDYVVLAGPDRPTTIVHPTITTRLAEPEVVVMQRVLG